MPIDRLRTAALIGLAGCICGCASTAGSGLKFGQADNWGEATRQTLAAQIINPNPEYDTPLATGSGARAVAALERYRTDKIKQPARQSLSDVGETKSGGSGVAASGGN